METAHSTAAVTLAESPSIPSQPALPKPTAESERVEALDVLRGLVLLGILLMNINPFGLPHWADFNPTVAGGHTGIDWLTWFFDCVVVDGKMRALFSMLFGAGVILLTQRADAAGPEARARIADVYYRRMLWLGLFGLVDAYLLIWPGDILYHYALVGLVLFPLRKLRATTLVVTGLCLILAEIGISVCIHAGDLKTYNEVIALRADRDAGKELTEEQETTLKDWDDEIEEYSPPAKKIEKETELRRSGYTAQMAELAGIVKKVHSIPLYFGTDIASMMLIGMGFLKSGVITGRRSRRFYLTLTLCGVPFGWALAALDPIFSSGVNFNAEPPSPWWAAHAWTYPLQRILAALGYLGLVMLAVEWSPLKGMNRAIAAAGRIPLTNYLGQSVICMLLFSGVGLAWFNELRRHQLLLVAVAIWAVQVALSVLWLRVFLLGPMEWIWRWLSYRQRPPMLRG